MRFKPTAVNVANLGVGAVLTIALPLMYAKDLETITGRFKAGNEYELRPINKKRSLNSNSYLWILCDKIAQVIRSTKEDVYKDAVKHVGPFYQLSFPTAEDVEDFREKWVGNGLGWFMEVVDADMLIINAYYGSSRYNTKQMAKLIDYVQDECRDLDIETETSENVESMLREWGNNA